MNVKTSIPTRVRNLKTEMRGWLLAQSFLVWAAGGQLFILSDQTDKFFAWTIKPSLTAAFLGASYWATLFLMFLSAWELTWARARLAGPATWVFSILTLILTLLHLDRFHLDSFFGWTWLGVYICVPAVLLTLLIRQQVLVRAPDPPRGAALARWLQIALGVPATIMLLLGVAMFIAPTEVSKIWPWMLTPLTGRAVAAWLIGWGVALFHGLWENDWGRIYNLLIAYCWLGILNVVAVVRYSDTLDWGKINTWIYLLFIANFLIVGGLGWQTARQNRPAEERLGLSQRIRNVLGEKEPAL